MRLAPELLQLQHCVSRDLPLMRSRVLVELEHRGQTLPVYQLTLGSEAADVPVLFVVGGVHGVERIGAQVVLAFLETLIQRLAWDESLSVGLRSLRIHFVPVLNPIGLLEDRRGNGNGVDLMRNAPVEAEGQIPFLAGGHRISRRLPWFRGDRDHMEAEADALCRLVQQEVSRAPLTMVLDVHSGYGFRDRLWFPMAASQAPIPHLAETVALRDLIRTTYPHLDYAIEPQSQHYCTHGDLWDYLYLQACEEHRLLLPLTLEMGSWRWVKKNPLQLRRPFGMFNPVKPHRIKRVLRRHIVLMECLIRAVRSYHNWLPENETQREQLRRRGMESWYGEN